MSTAPTIRARFTDWLDDNERVFRWLAIREPRVWIAYKVSRLGNAIARLAVRIHHEVPGDYFDGFTDGEQFRARVNGRSNRRQAIALFERLGVDTSPETLARFGWGESK